MTDTPELDRRGRTRARRLDEITGAALELVRDEGLEGLTTHALARRLDLAVGALYRYFPSKTALLAAVERRALDELGAHLRRSLDASEGAFRGDRVALTRVALAGRAYARFARERRTEAGLIGQLLADPRVLVPGEDGAALVSTTMSLLGAVAALFSEAVDEATLPPGDAMDRAVLFWSGLRGVLELSKLTAHAPGFDAAPLADAMMCALLVGFGAEADAVRKAISAVQRFESKGRAKESGE